MHYYKRHVGDYARDTGHLSALEHGIYNLLIDWYYINERPIPDEKAHRIAKANREETIMVLSDFFKLEGDDWIHKRIESELAEYREKAEENRRNGAMGGRPKAKANQIETQTVSERLANAPPNHKPLTINHLKEKKRAVPAPPQPEGVADQVWQDWLALRKQKRAPVTETVLREAGVEAAKAGLSLDRFLAVWCARGSQGLQADWLKPQERGKPNGAAIPKSGFSDQDYLVNTRGEPLPGFQ